MLIFFLNSVILLGKSSLQKNILKISYGKFKKEFVKGISLQELIYRKL